MDGAVAPAIRLKERINRDILQSSTGDQIAPKSPSPECWSAEKKWTQKMGLPAGKVSLIEIRAFFGGLCCRSGFRFAKLRASQMFRTCNARRPKPFATDFATDAMSRRSPTEHFEQFKRGQGAGIGDNIAARRLD
jgi:hypothetical protein